MKEVSYIGLLYIHSMSRPAQGQPDRLRAPHDHTSHGRTAPQRCLFSHTIQRPPALLPACRLALSHALNRLLLHEPPYPQQKLCFDFVRHRGCVRCKRGVGTGAETHGPCLCGLVGCRCLTSPARRDLLRELLHRQLLVTLSSDQICAIKARGKTGLAAGRVVGKTVLAHPWCTA